MIAPLRWILTFLSRLEEARRRRKLLADLRVALRRTDRTRR